MTAPLKRIRTGTLEIAYEESGPADGASVLLMHGWPYDVRDYDQVVPLLAAKRCRVWGTIRRRNSLGQSST